MTIKALLDYDQRVTDLLNELLGRDREGRWTGWARLLAEVPDL